MLFTIFTILLFAFSQSVTAPKKECSIANLFKLMSCMSHMTEMNKKMKSVKVSISNDFPSEQTATEILNLCRETVNCLTHATCDGIEDQSPKIEESCSQMEFLSGPFRKCRSAIRDNKSASKKKFPCVAGFEGNNGTRCGADKERDACFKKILVGTCGEDDRYEMDFVTAHMNKLYNCTV